ncbi:mannitol dehydrogenase family protein [Glaciecola sp. MH2013]|uniref:mannitol dehydrogenase family protein n=1 Tax=Glaciecola sp. MH2013 TaxID=2785524 RepID=UPI0018A07729|nr:mannitol dehydrogenase family protein [Glaciecola sp. MH2013]MBF7073671.1 mannitol dehydrogenase family protein [Glaciecola sp. MH2013]
MSRLNATMLSNLPEEIDGPKYAPAEHGVGILHIGIGAFHRGHQAVFTDDAIARAGGDWRITGVSLRSPTVANQLNPQNGLYTVTEKSGGKSTSRVIASVAKVISARQNQSELLTSLASPSIKIITLTVTEKGYYFDQATGTLMWEAEDVQHDVLYPNQPVTMPGYLVLACQLRMKSEYSHTSKLTVISCDNLSENGRITEKVVIALATKISIELVEWISANVTFCSSMVDRIVPKVTQTDIENHIASAGYEDRGLIITEPFKQWVIEDNFCTERPDWESVGVLFVDKVADYEKLKIRTLNGSHSALAYMGVLLGYRYIHEAIGSDLLSNIVHQMMKDESGPTIPKFEGFNLAAYQQEIIARFSNSDIAYETQQVASDGSQKLQQRILAPLNELYTQGNSKPNSVLLATLVSWLRYIKKANEPEGFYDVVDPLATELTSIVDKYWESPSELILAIYESTSLIPRQLKLNKQFNDDFHCALHAIDEHGVETYLKQLTY